MHRDIGAGSCTGVWFSCMRQGGPVPVHFCRLWVQAENVRERLLRRAREIHVAGRHEIKYTAVVVEIDDERFATLGLGDVARHRESGDVGALRCRLQAHVFLRQVLVVVNELRGRAAARAQLNPVAIVVHAVVHHIRGHFHRKREVASHLSHNQRRVYVPEVDFDVFVGILLDDLHTPFLAEVSTAVIEGPGKVICGSLVCHVLVRSATVLLDHHSQLQRQTKTCQCRHVPQGY